MSSGLKVKNEKMLKLKYFVAHQNFEVSFLSMLIKKASRVA